MWRLERKEFEEEDVMLPSIIHQVKSLFWELVHAFQANIEMFHQSMLMYLVESSWIVEKEPWDNSRG